MGLLGSTAAMVWGFFFGIIGMAYFMYGKRQSRGAHLFSGAALCIYPFFVSSTWLLVLIGVALTAAPFLIDF